MIHVSKIPRSTVWWGVVFLMLLWLLVGTRTVAQSPSVTITVAGPSLTLTPTAAQVAALQSVVDAYNANERAGLTPWTVNDWLRSILVERVRSAVEASRATDARMACAAYQALPASDQKAIRDKLGGKSPCIP